MDLLILLLLSDNAPREIRNASQQAGTGYHWYFCEGMIGPYVVETCESVKAEGASVATELEDMKACGRVRGHFTLS